MQITIWLLAAFCIFTLSMHCVTTVVALMRCKPRELPLRRPRRPPAVTIVRPLCGLDHGIAETLGSGFALDYPRYDLVFCVAQANDPVIPLVERLIQQHPDIRATLLVGNDRISINPKLNNCVKGWRAATAPWIVLADANVLMPPDYIQRLLAAWQPDTGLVCSPPVGSDPDGFWADVECAFLNAYQARWQYFADTIGLGFAQGKTMLWRRDILEAAGGIRALGSEVAEDAASTKLVRAAGLQVRLVDGPFAQPLGRREAVAVWQRQVRWARLRRASFPLYFSAELVSGGFVAVLAAAATAALIGTSIVGAAGATAAFWYGSELLLAYACGWPLSWRTPLAAVMRDLLQPVIYFAGWRDAGFEWRGNAMTVDAAAATTTPSD